MLRAAFNNVLFCGIVSLVFLAVISCDDDKTKIISESRMEDILFDYHIADGISRVKRVDSITALHYYDEILAKHGVTGAEFDSSMVFYMKNAEKLNAIYERLADRMTNEARLQGIEGSSVVTFSSEGDTANIWTMEPVRVFSAYVPDNMMKFSCKADSTFKKGDIFALSFKTNFLYQDGAKSGLATLTIRFANDSVVTRSRALSSSSTTLLEIRDLKREGVKEVSGYILQRQSINGAERHNSTLRMMVVYDISLLRMHTDEPKDMIKADSLQTQSSLQSDMQSDSLQAQPKEITNDNIQNTNNNGKDPLMPVPLDTLRSRKQGMHQLHSRSRNQR